MGGLAMLIPRPRPDSAGRAGVRLLTPLMLLMPLTMLLLAVLYLVHRAPASDAPAAEPGPALKSGEDLARALREAGYEPTKRTEKWYRFTVRESDGWAFVVDVTVEWDP